LFRQPSIDALVEAPQQTGDWHTEDLAYPKEGSDRDGPSGFNLLPVSRRKTERNHIFLAEAFGLPQVADSSAQPIKEFSLIWHLRLCRVSRAETPRAD
jgi:hypothetical protein